MHQCESQAAAPLSPLQLTSPRVHQLVPNGRSGRVAHGVWQRARPRAAVTVDWVMTENKKHKKNNNPEEILIKQKWKISNKCEPVQQTRKWPRCGCSADGSLTFISQLWISLATPVCFFMRVVSESRESSQAEFSRSQWLQASFTHMHILVEGLGVDGLLLSQIALRDELQPRPPCFWQRWVTATAALWKKSYSA